MFMKYMTIFGIRDENNTLIIYLSKKMAVNTPITLK